MKQETLEEAANKANGYNVYAKETKAPIFNEGFIAGAKWQAEKMYSKEEVLEHLNILIMMSSSKLDEFTNDEEMVTIKWFEQFKKK